MTKKAVTIMLTAGALLLFSAPVFAANGALNPLLDLVEINFVL